MRIAFVVAIAVLVYAIMRSLSDESFWILPSLLPGLGGRNRPAIYEWGSLFLVLVSLWGVRKVLRSEE